MGKFKEKIKKFYENNKEVIWYTIGFGVTFSAVVVSDKMTAVRLEKKYEAARAAGKSINALGTDMIDGQCYLGAIDKVSGNAIIGGVSTGDLREIGQGLIDKANEYEATMKS